MPERKIIKTACQLCPESCGVNAYVEEGRIVKLDGMREHLWSKGKLCPKGAAALEFVYSPHRIRHPMKREESGWKQISWDEALDTIAQKLTQTKKQYGAKAVSVLFGNSVTDQDVAIWGLIERFCDAFGTPNRFDVDSMCFRGRLIGYILTLGKFVAPDVLNSNCILIWGANPPNSSPVLSRVIAERRKLGAKLLVIDPRRTFWAQRADVHAQLRPGTDCAFILGMLNVIISEGLYEKEFVEKWTVGFDRLKEHVASYSPEEVERITWVSAQTIREFARNYALNKPACIVRGGSSLDQQSSGVQISRAIAILQAISGNLDVPGGFISSSGRHWNALQLPQKRKEQPIGKDKYPLFYEVMGKPFGDCLGTLLWDAILTEKPYPIRTLVVSGCNPVLTFPDSTKVQQALEKLDFLVVMDCFMSDTAKLAHLVFPAATFLERSNICDIHRLLAGLPYVFLRKKAIEVEECWSDFKFWLQLAKRMGYEEDFPWQDENEILDYVLQPSGLSVGMLTEEHPEGIIHGTIKYREYETRGFRTPSGKVELYSDTLAKLGYDPLPKHLEPLESPISTPELAQEYPLILTTGARSLEYLHSRLHSVPILRQRMPEPLADVHPDTAVKYGIKNGDVVKVSTRRGSIKIKVKVTADVLPYLVSIPHAWPQANANILTEGTPADPISGCPALKGMLCKISKV